MIKELKLIFLKVLVNIGLILTKFDNNPEINTNDLTLINEKKIIIIYINMFFIKEDKNYAQIY